jgi:hypothetical protein
MNVFRVNPFYSMLILSIILVTKLQAAEFSPPKKSTFFSDKPLAKELFESATSIAMKHFIAIIEIYNLFNNYKNMCSAIDSSFNQTAQGIFLKFSNGTVEIYTPWGLLKHVNIPKDFLLNLIENKLLNAVMYQDQSFFYSIKAVQGIDLPKPILRMKDDFISYEKFAQLWAEMKIVYESIADFNK